MKTIAAFLASFVITATAFAVSWVSAEGTVHTVNTTVSGITYLKVERADGTKVNADCMISDAMRFKCLSAGNDDIATGTARCESGFCTWQVLDIYHIHQGGSQPEDSE